MSGVWSPLASFFGRGEMSKVPTPTPIDIYRQAVATRVADRTLSDAERNEFKSLQTELGLSDSDASKAYAEETRSIVEGYLQEALADGLLSPEEDASLIDLGKSLKVGLNFNDEITNKLLDQSRRAWTVLNKPLMPVDSPFRLKSDEKAFLVVFAEALEERSRTSAVSYAGPTVSIPVWEGIRFKMGRMAFLPEQTRFMHSFGKGALVVTGARILFSSNEKTFNLKLEKTLRLETFSDGLKVTANSGKPKVFRYETDRVAGLIVARVWAESGAGVGPGR